MNQEKRTQPRKTKGEQALQATVARLQLATSATRIGLYDYDLVTGEIHFSPEWKQQIGYTDDELPNRYEEWEKRLHPDDRLRVLNAIEHYLAGKAEEYAVEFRLRHKDGSYRWIYTRAEKELDPNGKTVRAYGCHIDITDRKEADQQLEQHQQRLKALAMQLAIAEERERRRLATELHDTVSQSLALARVQMANVRDSISDGDVAATFEELSATLLEALKSTRQIMADLSPPQINELGLCAAISEWLDEQVGARYDLKTTFRATGGEPKLNADVKALLFRDVRELLTNVVKHAEACQVIVSLEQTDEEIIIIVEDDGIGFDPDAAKSSKPSDEGGFGLFSIQERMSDLGGILKLVSSRGKGSTATLTLPLTPR